jgi:hypothetical protein
MEQVCALEINPGKTQFLLAKKLSEVIQFGLSPLFLASRDQLFLSCHMP